MFKLKKLKAAIISSILMALTLSGCSSENNKSNVEKNVKEASVVASVSDKQTDDNKKNQEENENNKETSNSEKQEVIQSKEAEIHFINTGNSDAILIKQGSKAALIDGGDNDDEQMIVSYLKNQNVKELEYIFATHPHADHVGGLDAVIKSISVKNIYVSNGEATSATYRDFITAMSDRGLYASVPLLNSEFSLGNSKFKVVSVANAKDVNNNSLVLVYTNGSDKVLFMGDAEAEIENKLNVGQVDLVKIGHHGSSTSSSNSFISKISPKYGVILVGKNNQYGHPSVSTLNTLKNNNIELHRTDECGNIVFKSSGSGLSTNCVKSVYQNTVIANSGTSSNNQTTTKPSTTTSNNQTTTKPAVTTPAPTVTPSQPSTPTTTGKIVYWTPGGKSYHTTKSCSTLSRSKIINSGTQAESGKHDPCDRCH